MAKLVVGCGYLGMRVALRWRDAGTAVFAVTRHNERAEEFITAGLTPIVADVNKRGTLAQLPEVESVLYAVGYDRLSGIPIREVYVDGLRNVLDALSPATKRVIYISSTGVYGQSDGEWVTEVSPCQPRRDSGAACLEAEQILAVHPRGARSITLRLAGIHGPGRIPRFDDLRAGKPVPASPDGFLNLIHVEDAVEVILAAEERAVPPRTYVVSDGNPVLRQDYYRELARLIGAPTPSFERPSTGTSPRRGDGSKRASNQRMLQELAVRLRYRSYQEALAAIVAECNLAGR